jgi:ornithine--oxo-acid transaminase
MPEVFQAERRATEVDRSSEERMQGELMPLTDEQLLAAKEFIALEDAYGAHNYLPLDVVIERAEGAWVYDVEGKRCLDCLAAYSAVNQGHCHPRILEALIEQARKVTLTSRAFRNAQLPLLYKDLHDLTGMEMSLLMNSGAETVETAVKAARKWGPNRGADQLFRR